MSLKRNLCDSQVTVTRTELYDVVKHAFNRSMNAKWDLGTYYAIEEQFELLLQMEKSKYGWFHRHSNGLFFLAGTSVLFITVKCLAEAYAGSR